MNGISSNNPKLLRSVSTPALCRIPLSDPWDQQQHRAWEHQGVGGQQRDCGLWGKVEGRTILLGLLEFILPTMLFTLYFFF